MDVHVPSAVSEQLRRRGVDVLTAIEDHSDTLDDHQLLDHARELGRVTVTQDVRFNAMAEHWQETGREFAGLVFAHQLGVTIGQMVSDLELIAKASDIDEWRNQIERLPL
jgi:hypothetical protein